MSRERPIEKICLNCSKVFLAKRRDVKYCCSNCRVRYSEKMKLTPIIIKEATPGIIARSKPEILNQVVEQVNKLIENTEDGNLDYCSCCFNLFYEKELYHHKSKVYHKDLSFCGKCASADVSPEYFGRSFEDRLVREWNECNPKGTERHLKCKK